MESPNDRYFPSTAVAAWSSAVELVTRCITRLSMSVPGATIRAMPGDLERLPAPVSPAAPGAGPAALDERSVYFLARLSPRYPTVEVRVADVCLDTGTAVLLAGLTRALVATALAEARRDAGGSRAGPAGRRGPGRGAAGARRGRSRPGHRAGRRCAGAPRPPPGSCLSRAQGPRRHRDDHHAAAPARPAGDRSRPPAGPVH